MARENSGYRQSCPFWSAQVMKCQLFRDGLFIPPNDHIAVYCQTYHHLQCRHYAQHAANQQQLAENNRSNRRRYERMPASHRVALFEQEQTRGAPFDSAALQSAIPAITLDLGQGGMGLTTEQPLPETSLLRFSFADSFPQSVQTGEGQVAWCNQQLNKPGFLAGISFQDDQFIETMGLYLGLIIGLPPSLD